MLQLKKIHDVFQAYREETMPSVYSNWDSLSDTEKESMARMNNFNCGLHIRVNFAEVAEKNIKQYEENIKNKILEQTLILIQRFIQRKIKAAVSVFS